MCLTISFATHPASTQPRTPTDELSVRLPLRLQAIALLNYASPVLFVVSLSSILLDIINQRITPSSPRISIDGPSGSRTTHHLDTSNVHVHSVSPRDERTSYATCLRILLTVCPGRVTIDILPDDVLLLVFLLDRLTYLDGSEGLDQPRPSWRWHQLVQVCRRWRPVVFASPNFLDLGLVCGPGTRVELTRTWPPLPIIIRNTISCPMPEDFDFDAAIMPHDRVYEIGLFLRSSQLLRLVLAMQKQLPTLLHLRLHHISVSSRHLAPAPALSNQFLGGFAP